MSDNGDCMTILGNECVQAIEKMTTNEVAKFPFRAGRCSEMNPTIPRECSGVIDTFLTQREYHAPPTAQRSQHPDAKAEMDPRYLDFTWKQSDPNSKFSTIQSGAESTHRVRTA
jgi:hypothetical protein